MDKNEHGKNLLIKNLIIITQNKKREIIDGEILVVGNEIRKIGSESEIEKYCNKNGISIDVKLNKDGEKNVGDKKRKKRKKKIAIPGLINTHTHTAMTLFRGYGEGLKLNDWLTKRIWPAESKLTDEKIYWGTLLGIAEMISSGTTTFNDMYLWTGIDELPKLSNKIGIRAVISYGLTDLTQNGDGENELKRTKTLIDKWKDGINNNGLVSIAVAPHSLYTCSKELIVKAKELSKKEGLLFHMHLSETRTELFEILNKTKKRPVEYLNELGVLDENSIFAHASWVSKREIKILSKNGASISHNPVSNLKLATGGICPVSEYDKLKVNITLGTDGAASNNSLNMFESMKFAALLQKHKYWNGAELPAQSVFDYATINGAQALKINSGSLEEGKLADIVLLDSDAPNLIPSYSPITNIVYSANPSNVSDVMINGKIVYKNKEFTNKLLDMDKINEKISEIALDIVDKNEKK